VIDGWPSLYFTDKLPIACEQRTATRVGDKSYTLLNRIVNWETSQFFHYYLNSTLEGTMGKAKLDCTHEHTTIPPLPYVSIYTVCKTVMLLFFDESRQVKQARHDTAVLVVSKDSLC
jgi:hypothetical protein